MENKNFEYCILQPTALEMTVSRQHWCVVESNVLAPQHCEFGRRMLSSPLQHINIELLGECFSKVRDEMRDKSVKSVSRLISTSKKHAPRVALLAAA
jgi:hypothetical protein